MDCLVGLVFQGRARPAEAVLTCAIALLLICPAARGGDFDDEPVGLRISLALDRTSSFTDTVGRTASVAYPLGSSVNPAGYDFLREPPLDYAGLVTLTDNLAVFESGASVMGLSSTGAFRLPEAGTLFATYIRTDSHQARSCQGDTFVLRSNEVTLGYSHRVREGLSLAGSAKLTDSSLGIDDSFAGFDRNTDTDSEGIDLKLGVLMAPAEDWLIGFCGGAGWTSSNTEGSLLLPPPPFGPGPVAIMVEDTTTSVNLRAGVGWRPSDAFGFYSDGQYLHLENGESSLDVGRLLVGLEVSPAKTVTVRFGGSIDTEKALTVSGGVGFYGIKGVPIEFAYSYNPFPETNHEFGRAHLFSVSIVVLF